MNIVRNALVLALLAASPAFAQNAPKPAAAAPAAQQPGGPDAAFAAWDADKNGSLSKDEFRKGWMIVRNEMLLQRLQVEFEQRDADKSGKIEAGEYAKLAFVPRLGKSAPAMNAFDANKNGGLEFPEYIDFIKNASRQAPKAK